MTVDEFLTSKGATQPSEVYPLSMIRVWLEEFNGTPAQVKDCKTCMYHALGEQQSPCFECLRDRGLDLTYPEWESY